MQMDEMTMARRFARFATEMPAPPVAVHRAANRAMLDTTGAIIAGSVHETVRAVAGLYGTGEGAATLCTGGHAGAESAALINGTAAHAWDIDDTSYTGIMHGSAVILPAVLAIAEEVGADRGAVMNAFIAGSEIAYVLADVCTHAHYFQGWWSTVTFGIVGSTAAVGCLLNLDEHAMTHAVGFAAAAAGGGKAVFGTDAKPLLVGETARRAISFARMAQAGLRGPEHVFEDGRGYLKLLNGGQSDPAPLDTLGVRWRLTSPGLLLKTSPVCSAAHAAIDQMVDLMDRSGAHPDEIVDIIADVPRLVFASLVCPDPENPQEAQFSLPYALACAALHGCVRFEDLRPEAVRAPQTLALMARVRVTVAEDLSTDDMRARFPESARLTLVLADGRRFSGFCGSAYGMPDRPLSDESLVGKFARAVAFAGKRGFDVSPDGFDPVETLARIANG